MISRPCQKKSVCPRGTSTSVPLLTAYLTKLQGVHKNGVHTEYGLISGLLQFKAQGEANAGLSLSLVYEMLTYWLNMGWLNSKSTINGLGTYNSNFKKASFQKTQLSCPRKVWKCKALLLDVPPRQTFS